MEPMIERKKTTMVYSSVNALNYCSHLFKPNKFFFVIMVLSIHLLVSLLKFLGCSFCALLVEVKCTLELAMISLQMEDFSSHLPEEEEEK